jgi:hypothetical protein
MRMRWYGIYHLLPAAAQTVVMILLGIGCLVAAAACFVHRRNGGALVLLLAGGLVLWAGLDARKAGPHPAERDILARFAPGLADRVGAAAGGGFRECKVSGVEVDDEAGSSGRLSGRILLHLVDARGTATDVPVDATWDPKFREWSAPAEISLGIVDADGSPEAAEEVSTVLRGEPWHHIAREDRSR